MLTRSLCRVHPTLKIASESRLPRFFSIFDTEVKMGSYRDFASLKRAEYEPQGVLESFEHPPPFSRSFLLVIGGFTAITVGAGLLTASPGIATKMAAYHLRLSVLSLLFFTGEDFAYGVMARTQPWSHSALSAVALALFGLTQAWFGAEILTDDGMGEDIRKVYGKTGALLAVATAGSLLVYRLPLWVRLWRSVMVAGIAVSLPLMYGRARYIEEHADDLFLR